MLQSSAIIVPCCLQNQRLLRGRNFGEGQLSLRLIEIDANDAEESDSVTVEIVHFPGGDYPAAQRLTVTEMLNRKHQYSD